MMNRAKLMHVFVSSIGTLTIIAMIAYFSQPTYAAAVRPSPRTRTFSAPPDNYYEQATTGHPCRWFDRDMPIRVLIKPGKDVPNYKPQYETILRESFLEWEKLSNSKIRFQFVNEKPAGITCRFVDALPGTSPNTGGTTSYSTSPHHMDRALISLRTSYTAATITDELFRSVCLHEVGHALGIVNHSLDPHDIMFPYTNSALKISSRDVKTIQMLYSFKPPEVVLKLDQLADKGRLKDFDYAERPASPHHVVLSDEEYDKYTREVVGQVQSKFAPFPARPILECDIRCFVDRIGNIHNYRIFKPSTNDQYDEKVLNAMIAALPFPGAPKLQNKNWSTIPIALRFCSDGNIIPYVEPDPVQSDWLTISEGLSPEEILKQIEKDQHATPKVTDENLIPWVVQVSEKAHAAWKPSKKGSTEVLIGITKDGKIAHMLIRTSSGDEAFDNNVLNACMSAEPYPVSPDNTKEVTEVNLLFEE